MITLALDASTYAGSVCVARGRHVLAAQTVAMRDRAREQLMPAVAATLERTGVAVRDVDRIVCGAGPGSFTSLRIAAAIAKGLATATGCPLHAVSSLVLMTASVEPPLGPGEYVAVLDALRGEAYVATCVVDDSGEVIGAGPVALSSADALRALEREGRTLIGDGRRLRATPHARGVVRASALLGQAGPVDVAAWEPEYGRLAEAQRRWEATHGRALSNA